MESQLLQIILIAAVPAGIAVGVAFVAVRVRQWTSSEERGFSDQGVIDTIGLGGSAILMFLGVDLMGSDATTVHGFLVTFIGGPLLIYLAYFYPRALRARLKSLAGQVEDLKKPKANP